MTETAVATTMNTGMDDRGRHTLRKGSQGATGLGRLGRSPAEGHYRGSTRLLKPAGRRGAFGGLLPARDATAQVCPGSMCSRPATCDPNLPQPAFNVTPATNERTIYHIRKHTGWMSACTSAGRGLGSTLRGSRAVMALEWSSDLFIRPCGLKLDENKITTTVQNENDPFVSSAHKGS